MFFFSFKAAHKKEWNKPDSVPDEEPAAIFAFQTSRCVVHVNFTEYANVYHFMKVKSVYVCVKMCGPDQFRLSSAVETKHVVIENCKYKLKMENKTLYPFYLYKKVKGMAQFNNYIFRIFF